MWTLDTGSKAASKSNVTLNCLINQTEFLNIWKHILNVYKWCTAEASVESHFNMSLMI